MNPELFAEIQQLGLQASDLEGRVNLLESGTTARLSSVGRMRATEEKRSQLEADGISPETGEAADPATKANGIIVLGFRWAFARRFVPDGLPPWAFPPQRLPCLDRPAFSGTAIVAFDAREPHLVALG